jgi:acetyltransferase-like isoleucine patch superfamily enzyme
MKEKNQIKDLLVNYKPFSIIINVLIVGTILFILVYVYNIAKSYHPLLQFLFLGLTLYITIFILIAAATILATIAKRIIPSVVEGEFTINSKEFKAYALNYGVHAIFYCSFFIYFFKFFGLQKLYYRIMGLKGRNYLISIWSIIIDPFLVEIGENASIGAYSLIASHLITREKIIMKRIKIGKNVTIGLRSTILPGVEIGDNSVIGAGSLVLPSTKIGKNEFWAGVPAKKIKNL